MGKRDTGRFARRTPGCVELGRDVDSVQSEKRFLCTDHTLFSVGFGCVFLTDDDGSKSLFGQRFSDSADKSPWQRVACFFKPTADASHVLIWSFFCQLSRGRVWLTKFSEGAVFFFLKVKS